MNWPKNTIATSEWLGNQGVYRQLADTYVSSGWLERIGRGAYKRSGDKPDWTGALYAIQTQLKLSVHAAGKTALQLQGYAHYLAMELETAILFGKPGEKLPVWFVRYPWEIKCRFTPTNLLDDKKDLGLADFKTGDYLTKISSAERAMFEVCYDVPDQESFEEAGLLMEGLTTLRPSLVQGILEKCNSVKAKRLFMYFAEEYGHAWLKQLNLSRVDFGKGNRSLCANGQGQYNKKYQLVVPKKGMAA